MAALPPSSNNSPFLEKALRWLIPAALIYGGIKLFNAFAPTLISFLQNVWIVIGIGAPLAFAALYIITNPMMVWMGYKNLCKSITSAFIKMDPLSFMDRYADLLVQKLGNLNETIVVLKGKKIKLDRKVDELEKTIEDNLRLGKAAVQQNKTNQASLYGAKVAGDRESLSMILPMQARVTKSLDFLAALSENWSFSIERLRYEINRKRTEYEIIKETTKGLKNAEDFINSDSEAAQIYGQSLKALEESVTQKIGYIEEFERKSKGIMDNISIEKQANQDEGLKILEAYMHNDDLKLPDFNANIETIPYEEVKTKPLVSKKFNLLNK